MWNEVLNNMKVFVYSCRDDEKILYDEYAEKLGIEFGICKEQPKDDNYELAKGYDVISVVGTKISEDLLKKFADNGLKCITARCIGVDHIPLEYAKKLGVKVSNITYSPNAVADYAILLMLMCLRKEKYILEHYKVNDYTLAQNCGRELRDMTVGIVGGGRIGRTVMKQISGFGCKMLVYDKYQMDEVKEYAQYVDYDYLLQNCDIITFHAPGTADTYHMLNMDNVCKLKKNCIIINTSRGSNIDTKALIYGIEQGIISAAGLDVLDNEPTIYNIDHKDKLIMDHDVAILESFPNVIITPHTAFYTEHAVRDMIENSLKNAVAYFEGKDMPGEIHI